MTNRRGPSTINSVKKGSREEEEALLQALLGFLVSLAEVLEVSPAPVAAEAHSREGRSPSIHPALGVVSAKADSTHRTQTRFSSKYLSATGRVIKKSNPAQTNIRQFRRNGGHGWHGWYAWYAWYGRYGWYQKQRVVDVQR